MSTLARSLCSRMSMSKLCFRPPQKNQLVGFARFSTVLAQYGNFESGKEHGQTSSGNRGIGHLIALGGLGLAFSAQEYHANCAEKQDEESCKDAASSSNFRKLDKEEENIEKANRDLESGLKEIKDKAMEATEAALQAYCGASEIIKEFMDKTYCAIERDDLDGAEFEETWCEIYDLALSRCEQVKDAMEKGRCAWELLCKLREILDMGKSCIYTSCNPLLITAEHFLECAERELLNARANMECIQSESQVAEQYREVVENFRRDIKTAAGSSAAECGTTEVDCAKIITEAYKKVLAIQKELALVQIGMGKVPAKQCETLC